MHRLQTSNGAAGIGAQRAQLGMLALQGVQVLGALRKKPFSQTLQVVVVPSFVQVRQRGTSRLQSLHDWRVSG